MIKGRKVAIDASMCLYQFLIAVRSDGSQLTDTDGDITRSEMLIQQKKQSIVVV